MFIFFVGVRTLDDPFMLVVTTALVQAWWVDKGTSPKDVVRDRRRGDRDRERDQERGDSYGYGSRGFVHDVTFNRELE